MPTSTTVALLDHRTNVLTVERHLFDQLSASQRDEVLKTSRPSIETN